MITYLESAQYSMTLAPYNHGVANNWKFTFDKMLVRYPCSVSSVINLFFRSTRSRRKYVPQHSLACLNLIHRFVWRLNDGH